MRNKACRGPEESERVQNRNNTINLTLLDQMFLEQDRENTQSGKTRGTKESSGQGQFVGIFGSEFVDVLQQVHQGIFKSPLQVLVATHELVENLDMFFDTGKIILSLKDAEGTGWSSVLEKSTTGS